MKEMLEDLSMPFDLGVPRTRARFPRGRVLITCATGKSDLATCGQAVLG